MATVTIANLIHRAEWDGEPNSISWVGAVPVCDCGDDISEGKTARVIFLPKRTYEPHVLCHICERTYLIVETN